MMRYLAPFLTTAICLLPSIAHAQTYQPSNRPPVADLTLGTQVSGSSNNFNITGGVSKGQTLFHSFTDFSVPTNGQANFLNPVGNRDIITRVTGSSFSDINGLVNTNGANFFLLNPNGIVFGTNARLNVGKAFVGSTANSIDLVDAGGRMITFGTNPNGDAPLLSVAPNVLFDVSRLNLGGGSGAISNFGTLQTNNNSQYIGLIGGNVTLNGSDGGGKIIAPGGRIDIGGLNSAGTVTVDNNGLVFAGNGLKRSDVLLTNGAGLIVRATGTIDTVNTFFNNVTSPGSSININASNVNILNSGAKLNNQPAAIDAGLEVNSGVQTIAAGGIKIDATGKVNLNNSDIKNTLRPGSEGTIGDIKIQASALDIQNNSVISSSTAGNGNAGNIELKANGDINLTNGSFIVSDTRETARGNAGDIKIQANGDIKIDGNQSVSSISSDTDGYGDTGKITIDTQGKLFLNRGTITSSIGQTGVGNGRGILITARELELVNVSQIETYTDQTNRVDGKGNGGDINIKTSGDIRIAGSNLLPDNSTSSQIATIYSTSNGYGDTGKITINTQGKLLVTNRGVITNEVAQNGVGNSKGISISARELELANSSYISTSKFQSDRVDGKGNAGDIDIRTTGDIKVSGYDSSATNPISDISFISSTNNGRGDAGKITIDTPGKLSVVDRGLIFSSIGEKAVGNSQGININVGELKLNNRSIISTTTLQSDALSENISQRVGGTGNGGDINLNIKGSIETNNSFIIAGSSGIGKSGDLNLNVKGSIVANNSSIVTGSTGTGATGNISVNSDRLLLNKSGILSSGKSVTGGNLNLATSDKILMRNNSEIDSQSGSRDRNGNGGNITISSPLIIALPGNNDINANANGGTGGNVNITSQGLFGIQYRPTGQASLYTNDITASSTFGQNGTVNINTPGTDPGKDSTELPNTTTDASNQISQVCNANNRQNKLIVTGRGGIPPNANDPLVSDAWQDPRATDSQPAIASATTDHTQIAPPAVGWVIDGKGKVTLIAAGTAGQSIGTRVVCPDRVGK